MKYGLFLLLSAFALCTSEAQAQQQRWQMRIAYQMEIDMDVKTHQFKGKQRVILYNNSNEKLDKVFYHLYLNAFQPNSMMDIRSQTLTDPDKRVADRISKLKPNEIGYQIVRSLRQGSTELKYTTNETILEVQLARPIPAGGVDTFDMVFDAQVPIQVRRNGRNSSEGIDYSMSQWYPKMCNFDEQGWHANPYVLREFYGIWGDFDVKITIASNYVLGATGYLQNGNEIGYGYEDTGAKVNYEGKTKNTWHFIAPNVHDFVWAADPDFNHDVVDLNDTIKIHFLYQENGEFKENWKKSQDYMSRAFKFIQAQYGVYPYRQYSFIQGGDGGMEYPMATLITGKRNVGSLVGVMVHELMHNWYQMLMATNESLYGWMDEGFTSFASEVVMANLFNTNVLTSHEGSYKGYFNMVDQKIEEPLITHADHYSSNTAYGQGVYSKGSVFLFQLEYIIGKPAFDKGMLDYYDAWRFRHPNANDFIRIMEKASGLELDWYREYFINTTHFIDYAVRELVSEENSKETRIMLERVGKMPMPIELVVEYTNDKGKSTEQLYYIPLDLMRGEKVNEGLYNGTRIILPDWRWTHPKYEVRIPIPAENIKKISIDPSNRLADYKRNNNTYVPPTKK
jgi:hypothetical protein